MDTVIENLTIAQQVIRERPAQPLAGHSLIVFESLGDGGEVLRFELEPGQSLPKSRVSLFSRILGRGESSYFAFAINRAPRLAYEFAEHFRMDDQHELTIDFRLTFAVADGVTVATLRHQDPLRCLRNEIAARIGHEFVQRSWSEVCYRFRSAEEEVLSGTLPILSEFAAEFGLRIVDLRLKPMLPEAIAGAVAKEDALDAEKAEAGRKAQLEQARMKEESATKDVRRTLDLHELAETHKLEVARLTRLSERGDLEAEVQRQVVGRQTTQALADAAKRVLENLSESTHTPADLNEAIAAFVQISQAVPLVVGGGAARAGALGRPFLSPQAVRAALPESGGVADALNGMITQTDQLSCSVDERKTLRSSILHVMAELLLDDPDEEFVRRHASIIKELTAKIQPPPEQFHYLKDVAGCETLRYQLR